MVDIKTIVILYALTQVLLIGGHTLYKNSVKCKKSVGFFDTYYKGDCTKFGISTKEFPIKGVKNE